MTEVRVSGINVYPIKSCAPYSHSSHELGELGLKYDRSFMLIGNRGQMITQRTSPELALVRTALCKFDRDSILATAPNHGDLLLDTEYDEDAQEFDIELFKKVGTGIEVPEGSEFFSDYLAKDVRLVQIKQPRTIKPECQVEGAVSQTGFADGFPILLVSKESLDDLNTNLEEPVSIDRFRANIIVEGASAYDEDYWREIRIGSLRAFVVRACARCPMPNIDQAVGELPKERPVTAALRQHHGGIDPVNDSRGEFFGQNLVHVFEPGQSIHVGATVEVIERAPERNILLDN